MRAAAARLLLAGVSLLVALAAAELVLRSLGYFGARGARVEKLRLVDDPIVDYRRIPNVSWVYNNLRYDTNSHGWRDVEHGFAKPPGSYRIAALGDSVTNGHGVQLEEIWAKVLERRLDAEPPFEADFEVLLLTLGALNTEQEAHLAEVEGLRYDPDLFIVGYVLNDPEAGASLRRDMERAERRDLVATAKEWGMGSSVAHLLYRSGQRLLWSVRRALGRTQVADYVVGDYFERLHRDPRGWARVTRGLDRLGRLSRQHGIPVVLAIFPVLYQLDDYPYAEIHRQVAAAAGERGLQVVDLLPAFASREANELQVAEGDHVHPNADGHRVAAEAIGAYLRQRILAPSR